MKNALFAFVASVPLLFATGAAAQESQAKSWGLTGEEAAIVSGKVVDILCELSGDCPDNCGGGSRQLGILTEAGKLILVSKNAQAAFNGAIDDLLPYCAKAVDLDGLWVGEGGPRFYQVQLIREQGNEEWAKANLWTKKWAERFPQAEGKGPWFRRDPRVLKQIEERGYLGFGPEADIAFIKDWY